MTTDDPVITSLEHLAERTGDVSEEIYHRFAERSPTSTALMQHMDDYMVGRMMQDVLVLLMTPPDDVDRHYLSFEVSSHENYGVTPDMFPPLFEAVRDTLRSHLADTWSDDLDRAWSERFEAVLREIESAVTAQTDSPA